MSAFTWFYAIKFTCTYKLTNARSLIPEHRTSYDHWLLLADENIRSQLSPRSFYSSIASLVVEKWPCQFEKFLHSEIWFFQAFSGSYNFWNKNDLQDKNASSILVFFLLKLDSWLLRKSCFKLGISKCSEISLFWKNSLFLKIGRC